ncbi:MAG: arylmalonate decarboxylase, partial [Betaproteobacteria bacterium]|nr:arylmalonate decarboxylase [Betaproteobacteria bacterium]
MTDALGWRRKFAVLVPSTNTVVQPEFDAMRPEGVTNHISRIRIPNMPLASDADFRLLVERIAAA